MVEYQNINANESGLAVRAKLNNMFKALISSNEGVNKLWQSIVELTTKTGEVQQDSDDKYQELKEQLLKSFDYTDKTADDLLVYINGINGGVSGFAVDPTFKPEFPTDVAATVLAAGAGTYVNFLDSNGQAITITESDAITIFYKAKGVTFWQYKSIYARATINNIINKSLLCIEFDDDTGELNAIIGQDSTVSSAYTDEDGNVIIEQEII